MSGGNRLLPLPAAFANPRNLMAPVGYGDALWEGYFDAGYSRPGDYIAGPDGVSLLRRSRASGRCCASGPTAC